MSLPERPKVQEVLWPPRQIGPSNTRWAPSLAAARYGVPGGLGVGSGEQFGIHAFGRAEQWADAGSPTWTRCLPFSAEGGLASD